MRGAAGDLIAVGGTLGEREWRTPTADFLGAPTLI
jgi:hypothetical protein